MSPFSDSELEAFLDEALPPERMSAIEQTLRETPEFAQRLMAINARRDAGVHSLGEVWRRHALTCLNRSTLGSYLLNVLPEAEQRYVAFHLERIGCRVCQANLDDLKSRHADENEAVATRRRKYFQSSAGLLPRDPR